MQSRLSHRDQTIESDANFDLLNLTRTAGVPIFNLGLKVFLNVNAKYNICLTI